VVEIPARPRPSDTVPVGTTSVGLHVEVPDGDGPWPAVVVLHDASGFTSDTVEQCRWLAGAGFIAAAPDLFDGGSLLGCLRQAIGQYATWEGRVFEQVEAVRSALAGRSDCTGRVGVLGFCLGGGFALSLAPGHGFQAASANYGVLPKDADRFFAGACPVIGSYGGRDRMLKGAAARLESSLSAAGVPHEVHEYPQAGHAFLNDHGPGEVPALFHLFAPLIRAGYHRPSAELARERIEAFLHEHLTGDVPPESRPDGPTTDPSRD
jgi:carboxymethylenebutenolidase